ncbi:putative 3-5 exonuclease [Planoprotostelium fungivorum]|uniref:3'-5' exonuclease n=1 Tax=Planoprotostelium fungivorum TaxID=1890364 RepID=A0A2P6NDX1_9EUKA|nr:putative 3-5 exonuclease [Planoprotostelium fungivorum]
MSYGIKIKSPVAPLSMTQRRNYCSSVDLRSSAMFEFQTFEIQGFLNSFSVRRFSSFQRRSSDPLKPRLYDFLTVQTAKPITGQHIVRWFPNNPPKPPPHFLGNFIRLYFEDKDDLWYGVVDHLKANRSKVTSTPEGFFMCPPTERAGTVAIILKEKNITPRVRLELDQQRSTKTDRFRGETRVVDHPSQVEDSIRFLLEDHPDEAILGMDLEWKPYIEPAPATIPSLLQLSTRTRAVLFRLLPLCGSSVEEFKAPTALPPPLVALLQNPKIRKVGVALDGDVYKMRHFFGVETLNTVDISNMPLTQRCQKKGLAWLSSAFLGFQPEKGPQMSNWEAEELSASQIHYAATDAHCSLEIYNQMERVQYKTWYERLKETEEVCISQSPQQIDFLHELHPTLLVDCVDHGVLLRGIKLNAGELYTKSSFALCVERAPPNYFSLHTSDQLDIYLITAGDGSGAHESSTWHNTPSPDGLGVSRWMVTLTEGHTEDVSNAIATMGGRSNC